MASFGIPSSISEFQGQKSGALQGTYNPMNNPNSPEFQAAFQKAAASGYFDNPDPYGINGLVNSAAYKGAGNNTQAYDEAYQNAVNASRSNITQALGAAMTELNNRQGAITAAGAAAPGQIDASYGRAQDAINANTGAVTGIMGQAQVNPQIGPSMAAANAPVQAALQGNQAEAQAGVQPIVSGLGAEISKERASLQTDAGDKLSALGMQAADHAAASASAANEPSWMQKMMIQNQIDSQQAKASNDAKAAAATAKKGTALSVLNNQTSVVGPTSGKTLANNKLNPDGIASIRAGGSGRTGQAYAAAKATLGAQMQKDAQAGGSANPKAMKSAYQKLMHTYPKQGQAVSIALYDLGMSQKDWQHVLGS